MGACGLEFRKRIFGTAGRRPSAALYGGASFGYNRLATDMRRRPPLRDTGGVAVSGARP
jgi:3-deoxy-D-manno-octulosonic acid (KDO) 8-phosphate synthase